MDKMVVQVEDVEANAVDEVNKAKAKRDQPAPDTDEITFDSDVEAVQAKDMRESANIQRQPRFTPPSQRTAGEDDAAQGGLTYLPPSEVQAMVKRLWETNYSVLRYLFCAGTAISRSLCTMSLLHRPRSPSRHRPGGPPRRLAHALCAGSPRGAKHVSPPLARG